MRLLGESALGTSCISNDRKAPGLGVLDIATTAIVDD